MYTGVHVILGDHNQQVVAMFAELHAFGTPIPCATVLNDLGLFRAIRTASPETFLNFRYRSDQGENPDAGHLTYLLGRVWWENKRGNLPLGEANCYQICNEFNFKGMDYGAFSDFFQGMMDAANADNAKVCIGNISSANPEPSDFAALAPMLRQAEAQGHVVVLHLYSPANADGDKSMYADRQDYVDRWIPMIRPYPNLNVLFAEEGNGSANYQGPAQTLVLMKQCEEIHVNSYARICKLIGGCFWSCGNSGGWEHSCIDAALPLYIDWRKSFMGGILPTQPTGLPTPIMTSPTLGLADFVRDTAADSPDEPLVVSKFYPDTPPKSYELTLSTISQGTSHVLPAAPVATWNVAVTASALRIRTAPNANAPIAGQYHQWSVISVLAVDEATLKANNNYVQIVGQPGHWIAYQWLAATALKPTA